MVSIEDLRCIELFEKIDDEILSQVSSICTKKSYYKNSILYFEDDKTSSLVYLKSGIVKMYKIDRFDNEIFLYYIKSGRLISYIEDIDNSIIRCYANTAFESDSEIIIIDLKKFRQILLANNLLLYNFTKELLRKNSELQCVLSNELTNDATSKVANFLYNELEIFNSIKRQEISHILHIQPETLSRILKKFVKNNIIDINKGDITILNHNELKSYIG